MKYNLSEISELIKDRRTITPDKYSGREVHDEIIKSILTSGLWAPTHGMTQPWFFKVFKHKANERLGDFLADLYKKSTPEEKYVQAKFDKLSSRPRQASAVVALCMKRDPREKIMEIEEVEAVACAAQNVMLHATAYGIGSFWSTPKVMYMDEMKTFLNLEGNDRCLGLLYLGYPEDEWPKSHRKPLEYMSEWIVE